MGSAMHRCGQNGPMPRRRSRHPEARHRRRLGWPGTAVVLLTVRRVRSGDDVTAVLLFSADTPWLARDRTRVVGIAAATAESGPADRRPAPGMIPTQASAQSVTASRRRRDRASAFDIPQSGDRSVRARRRVLARRLASGSASVQPDRRARAHPHCRTVSRTTWIPTIAATIVASVKCEWDLCCPVRSR